MSDIKDGFDELLENEENFMGMWKQFKNEVKVNAIERSSITRYNERQKERNICQIESIFC